MRYISVKSIIIILFICALLQDAYAMKKCVNEAGRTIFTNTQCQDGYFEFGQKKEVKKQEIISVQSQDNNDVQINSGVSDSPTPCDQVSIAEADYEGITLSVERVECFLKIDNAYEKPGKGNLFFALLINIQNNGEFALYGGSDDYHGTFSILTKDGFEIQALNTASTAWKKNRIVWSADLIAIGDKRKGWIVFSIPERSVPETLLFSVDRWNSPHELTGIGTLNILL